MIADTGRFAGFRNWILAHERLLLWLLVGGGVILRLAVVLLRGTYADDMSGTDHGSIVYNLDAGRGYVYKGLPTSFFGPVYTYLWAWSMRLFGHDGGQLVLQLVQSALLGLAPALLLPFLRRFLDGIGPVLAVAVFSFYPEYLVLGSTMFADGLMTALWCGVLGLVGGLRPDRGRFLGRAALAGLLAGVAVLTKGRMLAFIGVLVIGMTWGRMLVPAARNRRVQAGAILLLVMALVMAPWVVRNQRVHREFVLTEASAGFNFWIGHNAAATGTGKAALGLSNYNRGVSQPIAVFPKSAEMTRTLKASGSEVARDDVYLQQALGDIRENPAREIGLSLRKIAYAWLLDPTNSVVRSPVYWGPWAIVLALFLVGVVVRRRLWLRPDAVLWALLAASTALQVAFFVIPRLRYPFYPIVFIFAAQGLAVLLGQGRPQAELTSAGTPPEQPRR